VRFQVRVPDPHKEIGRASAQHKRDVRRAAIIATDRASREAQLAIRQKMLAMKLGRLGNAVGQTSMKRRGGGGDPYGVLFARGGDQSLAGGALEAYSKGVTIRAQQRQWLAFATDAVPRRIGRYRTTPALYQLSKQATGMRLEFRPLGPNRAILVLKNVTLHPKTGVAKAAGKRTPRTRIPAKEVVAFVLIRQTTRAQRFNKDQIVQVIVSRRMAAFMLEALESIRAARGGGSAIAP
jgi:hypothetical protein